MVEEDEGDREQCGRITSRNGQKMSYNGLYQSGTRSRTMEIHDSRPVDYRWHIMMMMTINTQGCMHRVVGCRIKTFHTNVSKLHSMIDETVVRAFSIMYASLIKPDG